MNKYKTAAYEVKSEIDGIFESSSIKNKPWQLLGYNIMSRTLLATYEELGGIYKAKASERLGFEVSEDMVCIPSLFVKLSGSHTLTTEIVIGEEQSAGKLVSRFNSISDFNCHDEYYVDIEPDQVQLVLDKDGMLDKAKVLESPIFKYRFLKREYQELIIDKINCIISEKNNLFFEHISRNSPLEIACSLLSIDHNIISLFNNFDFMNEVPKVIIKNEGAGVFTNSQAYVLALLNQLSYDMVIVSENGYADIENVFKDIHFSIFYGLRKDNRALKKEKADKLIILKKFNKIVITALASAGVLAGGFLFYNAAAQMREFAIKQISTVSSKLFNNETSNAQYSNSINNLPNRTVKIVSITPAGPLKAGVETEFKVVVDYNMTGLDNLILNIGVNDGNSTLGKFSTIGVPLDEAKIEERLFIKNSVPLTKDKLKGRYTLVFKATPAKWVNESFQVQAAVMNMSIQQSKKTVARSVQTFDVK